MRAILIDDDVVALDNLEKCIRKLSKIRVVGKYTNPEEGYYAIMKEHPDVLFTGIEICEINGMSLAKKVREMYPAINIVFVTAHSQYAVDAFELEAVDYLKKPINMDRFMNTINRLKMRKKEKLKNLPIVCCFKTLKFKKSLFQDQIDVNWRTTKARELFAFLIHNRFESVRKDVIIDILWPDRDIKSASSQLYSTVYQIRRTMEAIQFPIKIVNTNNQYKVNMNGVQTDVDILEETLEYLDLHSEENVNQFKRLLRLYEGDYLEEDHYHWALSEQNRLKVLWVAHLNRLTDYYISRKKYADAIMLYLYYQSISSYNEEIYFKLMQLFDKFGDRKSIEMQYKKLKAMMREQFDDVPREEIRQWYKNKIKRRFYAKRKTELDF